MLRFDGTNNGVWSSLRSLAPTVRFVLHSNQRRPRGGIDAHRRLPGAPDPNGMRIMRESGDFSAIFSMKLTAVISSSPTMADIRGAGNKEVGSTEMYIDSMMLLAALLGLACVTFVLLVCTSWSSRESACPARRWSRRPTWEHDGETSEHG